MGPHAYHERTFSRSLAACYAVLVLFLCVFMFDILCVFFAYVFVCVFFLLLAVDFCTRIYGFSGRQNVSILVSCLRYHKTVLAFMVCLARVLFNITIFFFTITFFGTACFS